VGKRVGAHAAESPYILDFEAGARDAPVLDAASDVLGQLRIDLVAVADDLVVVEVADDAAHRARPDRAHVPLIVLDREARAVRVVHAPEERTGDNDGHVVGREASEVGDRGRALAQVNDP
jgi:hypothetical protein